MRFYAMMLLGTAALAAPANAQQALSSADRTAAFRAAGFTMQGGQWRACEAPQGSLYDPGKIELVRDLNGDGRLEAIITEGSSFCYGATEVAFVLVSKQANASWKKMLASPGIATVLATKGAGGWPDIEVGGPGFCFPVQRWNGASYGIVRFQYEGKACKPPR